MLNAVDFKLNTTINTERKPSPNIWADCPWLAIQSGKIDGTLFFDDFTEFWLPGTQTTEIMIGKYKVYNTGAGVIQVDAMPHSTTPLGTGGIISMPYTGRSSR